LVDFSDEDDLTYTLGNTGRLLNIGVLVVLIFFAYFQRLLELYSKRFRKSPATWQAELIASLLSWAELGHDRIGTEGQQLGSTNNLPPERRRVYSLFVVTPETFRRSFLCELLWILFYAAFGFLQVLVSLGLSPGASFEDEEEFPITAKPNFGQLLPPLLFGLQVFIVAGHILGQWCLGLIVCAAYS